MTSDTLLLFGVGVWHLSTLIAVGSNAKHISFYGDYIKGNETSIDLVLSWKPRETWASGEKYDVAERVYTGAITPMTIKNTVTGHLMFRLSVPAGVDDLYITETYVGGTTGSLKLNALLELI